MRVNYIGTEQWLSSMIIDEQREVWDILSTIDDRIIELRSTHLKKDNKITITINNDDPIILVAHKDMTVTGFRIRTLQDKTILYTLIESSNNE